MKVALIGAKGVIGKPILNELLQRGHEVPGTPGNMQKVFIGSGREPCI